MEDNEEEDFDDHFPGNAGIGALQAEAEAEARAPPPLMSPPVPYLPCI